MDKTNNLHNTMIKQGVDIQQSSRGNDINVIVILIICILMVLVCHPMVGLSVSFVDKTATRSSSTGGSDVVFVLVSMMVDSIFAFSGLILRYGCFIISFAYCCCISVLAEVNRDCIIHVDMPCPTMGQEASKHCMETLCFCFSCINVFFTGTVVVNAKLLCHPFHHLILLLYLFHRLCPNRWFYNESTPSLCFLLESSHLKKGLWRFPSGANKDWNLGKNLGKLIAMEEAGVMPIPGSVYIQQAKFPHLEIFSRGNMVLPFQIDMNMTIGGEMFFVNHW